MNIQQLRSSKILLIGDGCKDIYCFGSCTRISPEAPVPIFNMIGAEEKDGMALNVAKNLRGLGNEVDVVSNEEEIIKKRFIDKKTNQHLLRVDIGDMHPIREISSKTISEIDFAKYDCLVISDYNKGFITQDASRVIIGSALRYNKNYKIFVDSKKKDLAVFKGCIVKINKHEYEVASFGIKSGLDVIVTMGDQGAMYKDKIYETDRVEMFDVCGAGDTFLSALVTANLSGFSIEESIVFANKCASYSVRHLGVYGIKLEDLDEICF